MNSTTPQELPPPLPPIPTQVALPPPTKGKPFALTAVVIAVIGVLPLLVYFFNCIELLGSSRSYFSSGNPLLVILMGFVGLVIHAIGLVCGIVGSSMGIKKLGVIGAVANGCYLGAILLFGFIAIAGA